jgi:hypothetical protein
MKVIIPPPPPSYSVASFVQVFDAIKRSFLSTVSKDEATPRILLQAPDGKIWQVTVNNSGVITTAVNDGKDRV